MEIRGALADAVFLKHNAKLKEQVKRHPDISLRLWRDLNGTLALNQADAEPIVQIFSSAGLEKKLTRALRSHFSEKRYEAAQTFRSLVSGENLTVLCAALKRERYEYIKLALVFDILPMGADETFDSISASLRGASVAYFRSIQDMLSLSPPHFIDWAFRHGDSADPETKMVILSGARSHPVPWLKEYVGNHLVHDDPRVQSCAIATAEELYPEILADRAFFVKADIVSRRASVRSLAKTTHPLDLEAFSLFLKDPLIGDVAITALTEYVSRYPEEAYRILDYLNPLDDLDLRKSFSESLSGRLPFLLVAGPDPDRCRPVVEDCIDAGKSAGLIAFLNHNRHPDLNNRILQWIAPLTVSNQSFRSNCARFLNEVLRSELHIAASEVPKSTRKIPLTKTDRIVLALILLLILVLRNFQTRR